MGIATGCKHIVSVIHDVLIFLSPRAGFYPIFEEL
jgi:hypothetical protein